MGQLFSSLWATLFPSSRTYRLVLVGLDNAGKTTILYRLHLGQAVETHPTVGCNVESWSHRNLAFEVWDLGGQANLRPSWATYYRGTDAAVVVVDCTDRARIGIVKSEVGALLGHEHLAGAAVLVFANKQDCAGAMGPAELTTALGLDAVRRQAWHVQGCCGLTGEGLVEGLEWVSQRVAHLPPAPVGGVGGVVAPAVAPAAPAPAPAAAAPATAGTPAPTSTA